QQLMMGSLQVRGGKSSCLPTIGKGQELTALAFISHPSFFRGQEGVEACRQNRRCSVDICGESADRIGIIVPTQSAAGLNISGLRIDENVLEARRCTTVS